MASDYVKSLVRTWVPVAVAAIVTALVHAGIPLPAGSRTTLASLIGGVVGAGWYALVRLVEKKHPKLGWLLGTPGAPSYPSRAAVVAAAKDAVANAVVIEVKKAVKPAKVASKPPAKKTAAPKK